MLCPPPPWPLPRDVAAGVLILEEAGGRVTTMDGAAYSPFQRSLLASNDSLHSQVGGGVGGGEWSRWGGLLL